MPSDPRCSLETQRLIATIDDRERERDEALALNRQCVCTYCGQVDTLPPNEDRQVGLRRVMAEHIENCHKHPLKRIAEIVEPIQKERDELQRKLTAYQKLAAPAWEGEGGNG